MSTPLKDTRRHLWTATATLVAGVLIGLAPASSALAHAQVESSTPSPGQVLGEAPANVTLLFNEPVAIQEDQVRLLDSDGNTTPAQVSVAPATNAQGDEATSVSLTPDTTLNPGAWVVSWSAVSADGHIVSGLVDFAIDAPTSAEGDSHTGMGHEHAVHGAPDNRNRAGELPARVLEALSWLAGIAAGMLLAGSMARRRVGYLAGIGVAAAGVYAFSIAAPLGDFSLALQVGEVRAALAVVAAGAVAWLANGLYGRQRRQVGGALALALFASQGAWSGHHLLTGLWPVTVAHMTHLAAGAAWVGAVLALSAQRTVEQAGRTRTQATWAIVLLLPAAVITAAWTSGLPEGAPSWSGWTTVLLVKLAAVCAALIAGLLNHRLLSPARVEETLAHPQKVQRFLRIETIAIVAVIAASAALTLYTPTTATASTTGTPSPSSTAANTNAECTHSDLAWPATVSLTVANGEKANLTIAAAAEGTLLTLPAPAGTDPALGPATIVATHTGGAEVTFYLEPQGAAFSGITRLPLAGHWMLEAQVPVDAFTTSSGTGHVDIVHASCPTEPATSP